MSCPIWQRAPGAPPNAGGGGGGWNPPGPGGWKAGGGGWKPPPPGGGANAGGGAPYAGGGAAGPPACAMGVPQTLQNLSLGLATVPHCGHALIGSPSVRLLRAGPQGERGAQGEHIEVAPKSASDDCT